MLGVSLQGTSEEAHQGCSCLLGRRERVEGAGPTPATTPVQAQLPVLLPTVPGSCWRHVCRPGPGGDAPARHQNAPAPASESPSSNTGRADLAQVLKAMYAVNVGCRCAQ